MKKTVIVLFVSLIFFSCGSSQKKKKADEKQVITVSILPLKTFVEEISGDDFEINLLLPPGYSPADFTLIPSQMKSISRSQVWFLIGYTGFELSWREKIEQANRNMKVVNLSRNLDLIGDENLPSGEKGKLSGYNPHTWMSPVLVKQMAEQIAEELVLLRPDKQDEYRNNLTRFTEKINELDSEIKAFLKEFEGSRFIMFHPSLSYFARDYGLAEYSLEPGGKEPTPQRMAALVDFARENNIHTIFIQSDMDIEHAKVFAGEINGKVVQMWPLNPEWFENLREITRLLSESFNEQ